MNLHPYAKAVVAVVVALLTSLAIGADDNRLELGEVMAALASAAAAGAAVYGVPNRTDEL